jgi:hypothetical protein
MGSSRIHPNTVLALDLSDIRKESLLSNTGENLATRVENGEFATRN